jgi:CheY-like chemotaxis protein
MRSAPSLRAIKPANILLVDDNVHGIVARRTVLEELGYKTIAASSGREALNLVEQNQFDLIVTDYRMPSMDGVALIAALRERDFRNPIILLSGFLAYLGLTEQTTGADLLIQKSSNETEQLIRGVKRLLGTPKKPVGSQTKQQALKSHAGKG